MPTNKIQIPQQDWERLIRACHAENKSLTDKETLVAESLNILAEGNIKLCKLEDADTGKLKGYEIEDAAHNSIKRFDR